MELYVRDAPVCKYTDVNAIAIILIATQTTAMVFWEKHRLRQRSAKLNILVDRNAWKSTGRHFNCRSFKMNYESVWEVYYILKYAER